MGGEAAHGETSAAGEEVAVGLHKLCRGDAEVGGHAVDLAVAHSHKARPRAAGLAGLADVDDLLWRGGRGGRRCHARIGGIQARTWPEPKI